MKNLNTISIVASFLIAANLHATEQLSTITVTSATNSEQSIKDVTSNIKVITKEEIQERHYTTVSEALNSVAGISFTQNGTLGSTTSLLLRGNATERVLVLIDGVRFNDVTSGSGAPFEHLMMENIEQIEVVKGAQSGVWGADASAGVINIITNSAQKGTHGGVSLEYGSFQTKKYGVNLSHKEENYYVQGTLSRVSSDGFSSFEAKRSSDDYGKRWDELGREKDGYENTTGAFKAGYNFDEANKIDLAHTFINGYLDFDGPSSDTKNKSYTHDKFTSASYENKNSFAITTLSASRSDFNREYYYDSTDTSSFFNGETREYGLKTLLPYGEDSFVLVGADYKTFEHNNDINETFTNKAAYMTNSTKFNDGQTIVTQSLRKDNYDKFDDKTTGKIGFKHFFTHDLNLSSNYGTAYNVPTLYKLFSNYGNPNLSPETVKSFDLQVAYKDFSITYFKTDITDMIEYDFGTSKYANIDGESTLQGVELEYTQEVYEATLLSLNYTHLRTRDNKGEPLRRQPKRQLGFAIDYYGFNQWHLNLNGSYVGERYDDSARQVQTGNYTLWNSVVNYDISKHFKAYVKIENIFDKYYQTADGYATAERSAYVGIKASF